MSKAMLYASRIGNSEVLTRRNSVTTDEQGRFSLFNLADGEYTIRAYKEEDGYPDLTFLKKTPTRFSRSPISRQLSIVANFASVLSSHMRENSKGCA